MASKPILFSTPMVQAILDDRKSMTRRIINPQPCSEATQFERFIETVDCGFEARFGNNISAAICDRKPRYKVGDILWVRETWQKYLDGDIEKYCYKADMQNVIYTDADEEPIKWKPSIFMPREAARIFLRVTNVRVERVQKITPKDAWEEGCRIGNSFPWEKHIPELQQQCRDILFKSLWDGLNAKRGYGWDINPWVWVYEFERVNEDGNTELHDNS